MRSTGSGPLGALLMLAPLIAVPILAVVGIPQFAPGNLIDQRGSGRRSSEREFRTPDEPDVGEGRRASTDELFDPIDDSEIDDIQDPLADRKPDRNRRQHTKSRDTDELDRYAAIDDPIQEEENLEPSLSDFDSEDTDRPKSVRRPPPKVRRSKLDEEPADRRSARDLDKFLESRQEPAQSEVNAPADDSPTATRVAPPFRRPGQNAGRGTESATKGTSSRNRKNPGRESPEPERSEDDWLATANTEAPDVEAESVQQPSAAEVEAPPADELTWQRATQRLRKLGVGARMQYFTYLEDRDRFLFTCTAVSSDDSKSTKRFREEADEPLLAVRQVLEKLEAWQKSGEKPRNRVVADRDE